MIINTNAFLTSSSSSSSCVVVVVIIIYFFSLFVLSCVYFLNSHVCVCVCVYHRKTCRPTHCFIHSDVHQLVRTERYSSMLVRKSFSFFSCFFSSRVKSFVGRQHRTIESISALLITGATRNLDL
jgi:hypothetical protein